jgi:hypothetical protein
MRRRGGKKPPFTRSTHAPSTMRTATARAICCILEKLPYLLHVQRMREKSADFSGWHPVLTSQALPCSIGAFFFDRLGTDDLDAHCLLMYRVH